MKKPGIVLLLALLLVFGMSTLAAADTVESGTCGENLTWTLDSDGVLTISGTGKMDDYNYSAPWEDYVESIETVIISDGVTSIGTEAFALCSNLTVINIPASMTSIGQSAFIYCDSLTSISVDSGNIVFTSVDGVLFNKTKTELLKYPSGKNGHYSIPASVSSIGTEAFYKCNGLTSVSIPASVISIGEGAFYLCRSLTSINIPASVTSIGEHVFGYCDSLTDITVDAENGVYSSEDGVLFNYGKTELVCYPAGKEEDYYSIPTGVTRIWEWAFFNCRALSNVSIPDSVISIGVSAFAWSALYKDDDNWDNGVLYIGDALIEAKYDISGDYAIKTGTTVIADLAFAGCDDLTSITIPASVTSIGDNAFTSCEGLTGITIPAGVNNINAGTFASCRNLSEVTIPASITSVGYYAFYGCKSLTDVYYSGSADQWDAIAVDNSDNGNYYLINANIHPDSLTVIFDANGGSVGPGSKTVSKGETYGALPTPVRAGFAFDGWYLVPGGDIRITSSTIVELTGSQTLYAGWIAVEPPSLQKLSYRFSNSSSAFGYSQGYKIPYERYALIFGDTALAKILYSQDDQWGGSCYGMATTSGMFFQGDNDVLTFEFYQEASVPYDLAVNDFNTNWDLSLKAFIEAMQISQFSGRIQYLYDENDNKLAEMCSAVSYFQNSGDEPVVVCVFGSGLGHALLGYKLESVSSSQSRLYVYDCNYPNNTARYVTLYKDASGQYTGWYYYLNNAYHLGSNYDGCSITYIPYDDFYAIWQNRSTAVELNRNVDLLTLNSDYAKVYDFDGDLVAEIEDGEVIPRQNGVIPVLEFGVLADGEAAEEGSVSLWVPVDLYKVTNEDASLITFEVSMTNVDQSAMVSTSADEITFAVDDASELNYAAVNGTSEEYSIELYSTFEDEPEEVVMEGTTEQDGAALAQIAGVLYASGEESGTISVNGDPASSDIIAGDIPILPIPGSNHAVNIVNNTNDMATVGGIESGKTYSGEITFTVTCTKPYIVLYSVDDGATYSRLSPVEGEDRFSVNVTHDMTIVVALKGDINGDGLVNNKDVTRLMRYIKYHDVDVEEAALDVNGDGVVNNKDVTRLMRYIKYGDVQIY